LRQEIERAEWQYSSAMTSAGHQLPFTVTRVNIREMLDLSYADLVAQLRADSTLLQAFRGTLETWSAHLAQLRVESQTKDAGNY